MDHPNSLTLLAVHAHPDDESIGTGGILAKYEALGIMTVVVFCTRGEVGDIQNPDFIPPSPEMDITEIRQRELDRALQVLRVGSARFLGYRDSGMAGTPANNHPEAFARANPEKASGELVTIIRKIHPQVVVTYNEKGTYGHPDHIMANRITQLAFESAGNPHYIDPEGLPPWKPSKLYYTAISRTRIRMMVQLARERGETLPFDPEILGTPDEKITTTIDIRKFLDQKLRAIFCHESQFGPNSFFRRIPEEWKEEVFGYEHFECIRGCKGGKETDLFQGI